MKVSGKVPLNGYVLKIIQVNLSFLLYIYFRNTLSNSVFCAQWTNLVKLAKITRKQLKS